MKVLFHEVVAARYNADTAVLRTSDGDGEFLYRVDDGEYLHYHDDGYKEAEERALDLHHRAELLNQCLLLELRPVACLDEAGEVALSVGRNPIKPLTQDSPFQWAEKPDEKVLLAAFGSKTTVHIDALKTQFVSEFSVDALRARIVQVWKTLPVGYQMDLDDALDSDFHRETITILMFSIALNVMLEKQHVEVDFINGTVTLLLSESHRRLAS